MNVILEKSKRDKNEYHFFTLENKVKVLVIHDLNTEMKENDKSISNVSISVNTGSFSDPPHRQGVSHFLEHMIFMGSEKYPGENVFTEFIAQNGGYDNAYTENSFTNY